MKDWTQETIETFVSLLPLSVHVCNSISWQRLSRRILKELVCYEKENGDLLDRFFQSKYFPIRNQQENVVGFLELFETSDSTQD